MFGGVGFRSHRSQRKGEAILVTDILAKNDSPKNGSLFFHVLNTRLKLSLSQADSGTKLECKRQSLESNFMGKICPVMKQWQQLPTRSYDGPNL